MLTVIDSHTHLTQLDDTLYNNIEDYFEMAKEQNVEIKKAVVCLTPYQLPEIFENNQIKKDYKPLTEIHPELGRTLIPYFYVPHTTNNAKTPKWLDDINYDEYITNLKDIGFKGLKFHCTGGFDKKRYDMLNVGLNEGMSIQTHMNETHSMTDTLEKGEYQLSRIIEEITQSGNVFYGVHGIDLFINPRIEEKSNNDIMNDPVVKAYLNAGLPIDELLDELKESYAKPEIDVHFKKHNKLIQIIEDNIDNIYLGCSDNEHGKTSDYLHFKNTNSIQYTTLKQMIENESKILKHICFESDIFSNNIKFENHIDIINSTILRDEDKNNILYNNGKDYVRKIA